MIAVMLIGGMGTRLRPLTCDTPKPLLPVVNRPFLEYQFDVLKAHGIREVVLCTSYRPEVFKKTLGDGRRLGLRLRYVHEALPLGTGGALKNAQRFIAETALVLNGDILNALDITKFLKGHRASRAKVSIALTRVKDPTLYGSVETDASGRIEKFLEKPSWDEIKTNTVNAGAYLFEPEVLDKIPAGMNHSLERSLFPHLLQNGARLFGYVTTGYWIDIGSVEKYLQVHVDILRQAAPFKIKTPVYRKNGVYFGRGVRLGRETTLDPESGRIVVGPSSSLGDFVRLAGPTCVGKDCEIGKGASLENCVVLDGTKIGEGATLKGCVIGSDCLIGANCSVTGKTALGSRSRVEAFSAL